MAARIRLAEASDAEAIAAIYAPVVAGTQVSFEAVAPDAVEMRRRIAEIQVSYPWLVCDLGGGVAGYAYASKHRVRDAYRWSVDASVYIDEAFRRRGVGRGLYASLFAILSAQGFVNAYAGITLPNPASVALHEAVGFKRIGVYQRVGYKLGAWHDVGWWEMALNVHHGSPPEPVDMASIRARPDWTTLLSSGESMLRAMSIPAE